MLQEILLSNWIINGVIIGVTATLIMDSWALVLQRVYCVVPLNYAMLGRWLAHLCKGVLKHKNIGNAKAVSGELLIGWIAHYLIGIVFALTLLILTGDPSVVDSTQLHASVNVWFNNSHISLFIDATRYGIRNSRK